MHIKYDKAAIDPSLPGILLLSHGDLAIGLMDTVQAVIGTTSNIAAFTLSHEDDPSRYQEAFLSAANSFPEGSVILLDVFGGTPCTRLLLSAQEIQVPFCAFAGMNFPLVSEAIAARELFRGEELRNAIAEVIPYSIVDIVETKKPEKSRQKAAGCRNTQEVIYTQPLFITPFYLLKGYRSDRLDINIPVIPKAARRDGFTR